MVAVQGPSPEPPPQGEGEFLSWLCLWLLIAEDNSPRRGEHAADAVAY